MAWARTLDDKLYKDSEGNKVRTDDYESLPIELWNTTTFMTYLEYLNMIHFKQNPSTLNVKLTRIRIKSDMEAYGNEVLKKWMELAIKDWGGSARFPTASYMQLRQFKWNGFIDKAVSEVGRKDFHDPNELSAEELEDLFA